MHSHPEGQGSMHPNTSLHRLRVSKATKGRDHRRTDQHKALQAKVKTLEARMAALQPGSCIIRSSDPNHIINNTPVCQPQNRSPIVGSPCVGECALPKSAGEPSPHLCGGLASCAQSDTPVDPAVGPSAHMPVAGGGAVPWTASLARCGGA
jgi:hypothetical protein